MTSQDAVAAGLMENLRHEYSETATSYRHFSGLRFAILTVYVALVVALGSVALRVVGEGAGKEVSRMAAVGAFIVTVTFFTCERVCEFNRNYFVDVLKKLEGKLGFTTMTEMPKRRYARAAPMLATFYSFNLLFWLWIALRDLR
jgi:hypothetical protein